MQFLQACKLSPSMHRMTREAANDKFASHVITGFVAQTGVDSDNGF
jgi:hypothetical protein